MREKSGRAITGRESREEGKVKAGRGQYKKRDGSEQRGEEINGAEKRENQVEGERKSEELNTSRRRQ